MGQDYSYTQPSSSEVSSLDITFFLQAEAALYGDEAESSHNNADPFQYLPEHEADEGIPKTCYCGSDPCLATSYTSKDPGRRYFTCSNADDGECHVWKWFDVAVMEELTYIQREVREVNHHRTESDQKLVKLEETVSELTMKKTCVRDWLPWVVCVVVSVVVLIKEWVGAVHRLKRGGSDI